MNHERYKKAPNTKITTHHHHHKPIGKSRQGIPMKVRTFDVVLLLIIPIHRVVRRPCIFVRNKNDEEHWYYKKHGNSYG